MDNTGKTFTSSPAPGIEMPDRPQAPAFSEPGGLGGTADGPRGGGASAVRRWWILHHAVVLGAAASYFLLNDVNGLTVRELAILHEIGPRLAQTLSVFFAWMAWTPAAALAALALFVFRPQTQQWYERSSRWMLLPLGAAAMGFAPALSLILFTGCLHSYFFFAAAKILILAWFYQRILPAAPRPGESVGAAAPSPEQRRMGGASFGESILWFWFPAGMVMICMGWRQFFAGARQWTSVVSPLTIIFASQVLFILKNRDALERPAWVAAYSIAAGIFGLWPQEIVIRGTLEDQFAAGFGWLWAPAALAEAIPGAIHSQYFAPSAGALEYIQFMAGYANGVTRHFFGMLTAGSLTAGALFPFLTAMLIAIGARRRGWRAVWVFAVAPLWAVCLLCPRMPSVWKFTDWLDKGAIWDAAWLVYGAIIFPWLGIMVVFATQSSAAARPPLRAISGGARFYVRAAILYALFSALLSILFAFGAAWYLDRRAREFTLKLNPAASLERLNSLRGGPKTPFTPSVELQNKLSEGHSPGVEAFLRAEAKKHEARWKIILQTALEAGRIHPRDLTPEFQQTAGIIGHLMDRIAIYEFKEGRTAEALEITTASLQVINLACLRGWDANYHVDSMEAICFGQMREYILRADATSSTLVSRDILEKLNRGFELPADSPMLSGDSDPIFAWILKAPYCPMRWPVFLWFGEDLLRRWERSGQYWASHRIQNEMINYYWFRIQTRLRLFIARTGKYPSHWDEVDRLLGKDTLSQPSAVFFRPPAQYITLEKLNEDRLKLTWKPNIAPLWRAYVSPPNNTETLCRTPVSTSGKP